MHQFKWDVNIPQCLKLPPICKWDVIHPILTSHLWTEDTAAVLHVTFRSASPGNKTDGAQEKNIF